MFHVSHASQNGTRETFDKTSEFASFVFSLAQLW